MATRSNEDTLQAALEFFPGRASELLAQVRRNPGLADMCEELSAAQTALANTAALPAEVQAARREECRDWIARLTQEIEDTLAAGKVVPLGQRSQR